MKMMAMKCCITKKEKYRRSAPLEHVSFGDEHPGLHIPSLPNSPRQMSVDIPEDCNCTLILYPYNLNLLDSASYWKMYFLAVGLSLLVVCFAPLGRADGRTVVIVCPWNRAEGFAMPTRAFRSTHS